MSFKPEQNQSSPKQTLDQVPSRQQQSQQPSMPEQTQPQRQERKSSLHRHAVSNASFDFGFPGQAGQNVNVSTPFANTVTPPVFQPPIIQPQPIRQPFNFQDPTIPRESSPVSTTSVAVEARQFNGAKQVLHSTRNAIPSLHLFIQPKVTNSNWQLHLLLTKTNKISAKIQETITHR